MAVAFGEGGVKTVEDVAGCATDDLIGWNETVNGERKHQAGLLESFGLAADEANAIIMAARVTAGWIEAPAEKIETPAETAEEENE
jgi:N utilization substance protein A